MYNRVCIYRNRVSFNAELVYTFIITTNSDILINPVVGRQHCSREHKLGQNNLTKNLFTKNNHTKYRAINRWKTKYIQ